MMSPTRKQCIRKSETAQQSQRRGEVKPNDEVIINVKNPNSFVDNYIKAFHGNQKLVSETAYGAGEMLVTKDLHFVNWNLVFLEYQRFRDADFHIKVSLPYRICETSSLSPASKTRKQNKNLTYGSIFHLNNTLFVFKTYYCLSKYDDSCRIQICGFTLVCKLQLVPSYFVFRGPPSSEVLTT